MIIRRLTQPEANAIRSVLSVCFLCAASCSSSLPKPPASPAASLSDEQHYSISALKPLEGLSVQLQQELQAHSRKAQDSALIYGEYEYRLQQEPGAILPNLQRRKSGSTATFNTVLETTRELDLWTNAHFDQLRIHHSGTHIAFTIRAGTRSELYVKDLERNSLFKIPTSDPVYELSWGSSPNQLYYTTTSNLRPASLYYHDLHTDVRTKLLYEPGRHLSLSGSPSGTAIFLKRHKAGDVQVQFILPEREPRKLQSVRGQFRSLKAFEQAGRLFALAVLPNNTTTVVSIDSSGHTSVVFNPPQSFFLYEMDEMPQGFLLFASNDSEYQILAVNQSFALKAKQSFPITQGRKPWPSASSLSNSQHSFLIQSFTGSDTHGSYHLAEKTFHVPEQAEHPYQISVHMVPGFDGVGIPLTRLELKQPHNTAPTVQRPTVVEVYGAYGTTIDPSFHQERMVLLDRGYRIAIAHVRGGGMKGPRWHAAGIRSKKLTGLRDLLSCVHYLIDSNLARPDLLAVRARSAGAVLVSSAFNADPELFAGAVLDSPFLDPLSSMKDLDHFLTARELSEWGDPRLPGEREVLEAFSAPQNVSQREYPPLLITARRFDEYVDVSSSQLWVQELRRQGTGTPLQLLLPTRGSSHAGEAHYSDQQKMEALRLAFLIAVTDEAWRKKLLRSD